MKRERRNYPSDSFTVRRARKGDKETSQTKNNEEILGEQAWERCITIANTAVLPFRSNE